MATPRFLHTHLRDGSALMIASNQLDAVRIPQLEAGEQRYGLDREQPPINIVSEKEVIGVWRVASNAKDLNEIIELTDGGEAWSSAEQRCI